MALGAAIQGIAQVMVAPWVAKFGDHIPFYCQAEIYAQQGIRLDRATLGNWVGRACFHLRPVVDHQRERLKSADRIVMEFGGTVAPGAPRRFLEGDRGRFVQCPGLQERGSEDPA